MKALATAAKGKGAANVLRRARVIRARYGMAPDQMERRIGAVLDLVEEYGCRATLPITAVVVARHPRAIAEYAARGAEFPVHGYYHVDHAALPEYLQISQLARARHVFETCGLPVAGFRAPYLRWNDAVLRSVHENAFLYDCSQAMYWPVDVDVDVDPRSYRRGLDFCGALSAHDYPVVPWTENEILRIPYVLPDDESMVDRLDVKSPEATAAIWLNILHATHTRGELFTLAVHPERIDSCRPALVAVLDAARQSALSVWIARHDEIARWWRDRGSATIVATNGGPHRLSVTIKGPVGLTVLARKLDGPAAEPWSDGYDMLRATHFELDVEQRPFIGVHPASPHSLVSFLRDQGYVVEISDDRNRYSYFIERRDFARLDQRPLLEEIETGSFPLLRLGRWPHGARSALSITGDIDALTIGDYAYRMVGR